MKDQSFFKSVIRIAIPVAWVYFVIGLEEIVRWGISVRLFASRKWMVKIV